MENDVAEELATLKAQLQKLENGDMGAIILTEMPIDEKMFKDFQPGILPDLLSWKHEIENDVHRLMGFDPMFSAGPMQGTRRTATEVNKVVAGRELRLDWKREQLSIMFEDVVRKLLMVTFENWSGDQIVPVIGKDMATYYVRFSAQELASELSVRVDVEATRPRSKEERTNEIMQLMQMTAQLPVNHMYLVRNLAQYYDWASLQQMFPQGQEEPMSMGAFAQQQQAIPQEQVRQKQNNVLSAMGGKSA